MGRFHPFLEGVNEMFQWFLEDKVILPVVVVGMELNFTHFLDDLEPCNVFGVVDFDIGCDVLI
jgi:hypothetical protein